MEHKRLMQECFLSIEQLEKRDYLKAYLIYYTAPTIVGVKPSTIITINNQKGVKALWDSYGRKVIDELGLYVHTIKEDERKVTILLYHSISLEATLRQPKHRAFLKRFGYNNAALHQSLERLKDRFEHLCPHEMGIFLGFPLDEVIAYMECPNQECLLCGYWKVYKDQEYAEKTFKLFDQLRYNMLQSFVQDKTIAA
ncbi:DUF3793 family protein [Vallitalea okinawensis]|uniref:DUF3793 family protein n=1 Tax=Vallitalea okinawensis TaxID=2078660 RepID=UPI000CFC7586|nr:DUF3793 family protein [Vallitalea okinawensis]